jgi:hypothetical protein
MPENNHAPVSKADFEVGMKALRDYIDELWDYIDERTRDMQTELLRGFRSYQENTSVTLLG